MRDCGASWGRCLRARKVKAEDAVRNLTTSMNQIATELKTEEELEVEFKLDGVTQENVKFYDVIKAVEDNLIGSLKI